MARLYVRRSTGTSPQIHRGYRPSAADLAELPADAARGAQGGPTGLVGGRRERPVGLPRLLDGAEEQLRGRDLLGPEVERVRPRDRVDLVDEEHVVRKQEVQPPETADAG